jgi:murein DD-endopeptidase MepM/ murein hydrolase activator NlpD
MKHRERQRELFRSFVVEVLLPRRRHVMSALAFLLVTSVVLLVMDARLPFPSPAERILYDPTDWSLLFRHPAPPPPRLATTTVPALSVGGFSTLQPVVTFLLYKAKPGDTMSSIAAKLKLNVDSISSLNRVDGRGVHNLTVGEMLKIPSQDGIYMLAADDFDSQCKKYSVAAEDVLAANALSREDLKTGMQLFFPGVQHVGYAYALSTGVAVSLPLHGWESSNFGVREDPFTGAYARHSGVDIAAPMGSAIRSATDGVVSAAGWDNMLGNYVSVSAPMGYSYIYGHMSKILVAPGARIATGRVIGLVGETGYATGPHLHFEVRKNGVPQNPKYYLPGIR